MSEDDVSEAEGLSALCWCLSCRHAPRLDEGIAKLVLLKVQPKLLCNVDRSYEAMIFI